MGHLFQRIPRFLLLTTLILLSGCMTHQPRESETVVSFRSTWLMLPLINYSQTPMAGERGEAILETRLHAAGVKNLTIYPAEIPDDGLPLLNERLRYDNALAWARQQQAEYAITGTIEEWRYKSGLDGEPAVGLSLKIIKLPEEHVVWSGSAARAGWSRESLAATAQVVINELISEVRFN